MKDTTVPQGVLPAAAMPPVESPALPERTDQETDESGSMLVARVNSQPIFFDAYEKQLKQFRQALEVQDIDHKSTIGSEQLAQIQQQVLQTLINQAIIEQEAKKLGISVVEEQLEAKAQESASQNKDQFEMWLRINNFTYQDFKEMLRFQLIANQLFEQVTTNIPETAQQIQLHQILVGDETTAKMIIDQLKDEGSFAALAKQYSLDETSRAHGGDLGWFPKGIGMVPPEVEGIAFTLQPGEVSGPIQTSLGFHIVQLQGIEAARLVTLEMQQALKAQYFKEWLLKRQASSTIEKFVGS